MDIDVFCMMAHPDDAEIMCGGTLIKLKDQGHTVGIVDFTRGESGSRGNADTRASEARCAAGIIGADVRINLEFPDAGIENTVANRERVVRAIREYRPRLIITHDLNNRNPDHTNTALLVKEASFTAGLLKYGTGQPHYRPGKIIHTMEYFDFSPTFLIDVSDQYDRKMQSITCYHSQTDSSSGGPATYISSTRFLREIDARMRYYGSQLHVDYAEPFRMDSMMEVGDLVAEVALRSKIPGQGRE